MPTLASGLAYTRVASRPCRPLITTPFPSWSARATAKALIAARVSKRIEAQEAQALEMTPAGAVHLLGQLVELGHAFRR